MKISFDDFPKADKGLFGKKVVLGMEYEQRLNFLTAIDKPGKYGKLPGCYWTGREIFCQQVPKKYYPRIPPSQITDL